jgi:tetratricopeptide (TPR) repeat protein
MALNRADVNPSVGRFAGTRNLAAGHSRTAGTDASMTQAADSRLTDVRSTSSEAAMRSVQFARRAFLLALLLILAGGVSGCNKLKARDLLNKGVQAFKAGQFDVSIEDFKQAKDLDPSLQMAQVYLATAYASLYIPGAPSDENINHGKQAIAEFKDILERDPNNLTAIDGIGSLLFQMGGQPFDPKKFDESKTYHQRHIELKPQDPEPYYWIGVINWTLAYRGNAELRAEYNRSNIKKQIKDTDPLPPAVRADYVNKYGAMVDEGVSDLKKAIVNRPDYDDAMAYLNLLYRRKADMVDSMDERENLEKQADLLQDKVKEIKQYRVDHPPEAGAGS